jgi:hypothetical protein
MLTTILLLFNTLSHSQVSANGVFNKLIHYADSLYYIGDLDGASKLYERALVLNPYSFYPQGQLIKIKYPNRVTERVHVQLNHKGEVMLTITTIVVRVGYKLTIYRRTEAKWGDYHTKDGRQYNEGMWCTETE